MLPPLLVAVGLLLLLLLPPPVIAASAVPIPSGNEFMNAVVLNWGKDVVFTMDPAVTYTCDLYCYSAGTNFALDGFNGLEDSVTTVTSFEDLTFEAVITCTTPSSCLDDPTSCCTLDGENLRQVMYVTTTRATLTSLRFTRGAPTNVDGGGVGFHQTNATIVDCRFEDNDNIVNTNSVNEGTGGGGIFLRDSVVTLIRSLISSNKGGSKWGGGAVMVSQITMPSVFHSIQSTIESNEVASYNQLGGGGIYNYRGTVLLTTTSFSSNTVSHNGKGRDIYNDGGEVTVSDACPVGYTGVPTKGSYINVENDDSTSNTTFTGPKYSYTGENCEICAAGTVPSPDRSVCEPCPAGSYALLAAGECTSCPLGSTATTPSASGPEVCTTCPSGATSNANNTACVACAGGSYAASLPGLCRACPAGSHRPSSPNYADHDSMFDCLACASGTYSPANAATCTACPPSTSSDSLGATSNATCTTCAANTFTATEASATCTDCKSCPPGSYVSAPCTSSSNTICSPCPPGTASNSTNAPTCPACDPGAFSVTFSATSCTPCTSGRYNPEYGASTVDTCEPCSAGTASNVIGAPTSSSCTKCTPGKYSSVSAAASCTACPPGKKTSTPSSSSCSSCPSGMYSSSTLSSTSCTACAPGTYSPTESAASIATCSECRRDSFAPKSSPACTVCEFPLIPVADQSTCKPQLVCATDEYLADNSCIACDNTASILAITASLVSFIAITYYMQVRQGSEASLEEWSAKEEPP